MYGRLMMTFGLTAMIVGCGSQDSSSDLALTNGDKTSEYKSVVAIKTGKGYCSGTKVSSNHILTAAHCVASLKIGQKMTITNLPNRNVENTSQWHTGVLRQVHVSPDWDALCRDQSREGCWKGFSPFLNPISDVAVLQYETLPSTWSLAKIDLQPVQEAESLTIVGYGCDETDTVTFPNIVKRRKHTPSIAVDPATFEIDSAYVFTAGMDAGGEIHLANASLCPGDSGGPIIRRSSNSVVGVNSWSEINGEFNAHARFSSPHGSNILLESWLRKILPTSSFK